jgi:hypothetical protein
MSYNNASMNSSNMLERKPSANSVIGGPVRNSAELSKKQPTNSKNVFVSNSINKEGFNTTRPISSSDRKFVKASASPNTNPLSNNYVPRQNMSPLANKNAINVSARNEENAGKRAYSVNTKYDYRPNTNNSAQIKPNTNMGNSQNYNVEENYRYRDLRLNDEQKYYDKNGQGNSSKAAGNRYYSLNKNAPSPREDDAKFRAKIMPKNQASLMIKTDVNNNKLIKSTNNPSSYNKSPQINRSLAINKVNDSSFNKDRYARLYGSN